MASITSVISFFVFSLFTYSYAAPVVKEYSNTSPSYEFTTGTTMVQHEGSVDMKVRSYNYFYKVGV
jgi:hypothetical protein